MALGKLTKHSASYNGISSDLAVDGEQNQCSHTTTTTGQRAWWYVDLGYTHVINKVKLYHTDVGNDGEIRISERSLYLKYTLYIVCR